MGERVPQHVQNIIIKDYCDKNNYNYLLSVTEYTMKNSFLMLEKLINDLINVDGVILYSLFQLPEQSKYRTEILNRIINKKKIIIFACEQIKITLKKEIKRAEVIWSIKQSLPSCSDIQF
jgi:sporadic carbohydrate cluster protein (TIGR04323 family)